MTEPPNRRWPVKQLLTEVVGSGPKSAEDMTRAQARAAFEQILADEPDRTTLGAFWLANRWKRNTPTELAAFVDVMHEQSVRTAAPACSVVDCGANYDGKAETALLGVAAGLVAAAAGTNVAVHSGHHVPTKQGSAYLHVLSELGVPTDIPPETSAAMIDEVGFGFYPQGAVNPGIEALLPRRQQMGVRTFVNTIETLVNPAAARAHLGSFYHLSFAKKLAATVEASEELSFDRAVFIQGLEGYDDIRPGQTVVGDWQNGTFSDRTIEPRDYGIELTAEDLEVGNIAADSARITEAVLAGRRTGPFRDAVALNAAVRLYADDAVTSIVEGIDTATAVIDEGAAVPLLAALRTFESPRHATPAEG